MEGFYFKPQATMSMHDGVYTIEPPADASYVAIGYEKTAAMKALVALTPRLGDNDAADSHYFSTHSRSDLLTQMVNRANKQLGSIRITSVVAIFSGDRVAIIRILASESDSTGGSKERVVYQSADTKAKNLLTEVKVGYFDELAETVLARF
jgi:hypothetical protein